MKTKKVRWLDRIRKDRACQRSLNRTQSKTLVALASAVILSYERSRRVKPGGTYDGAGALQALIHLGQFAGAALRLELTTPMYEPTKETMSEFERRVCERALEAFEEHAELLHD